MAFPRGDSDLMVWLNNFAEKFSTHAATLGFTPAEVTAVQDDAAMLQYLIGDLLPGFKAAMQARTAYKDLIVNGPIGRKGGDIPPPPTTAAPPTLVEPGIIPRLRKIIQRIQVAPAYTQAIGEDLDITETQGNSSLVDTTSAKPTAKAIALPKSEVRIEFSKGGLDGVLIESRRKGEGDWINLATDHFSPYLDTRPPVAAGTPEVREYRLRYLKRDEPVGEWSDIISATTTP
ncbi:MAG TPA: hypothetical protein VF708_18515 [Pyrinomonadaceae bacterium]